MNISKNQKILNIISNIRDAHPSMINVFTNGGCFKFYVILHSIFPEAICYYNEHHVITEIDGKYYDITGRVKKTNHIKKIERKSISQMLR
jgi:hypothetical protein